MAAVTALAMIWNIKTMAASFRSHLLAIRTSDANWCRIWIKCLVLVSLDINFRVPSHGPSNISSQRINSVFRWRNFLISRRLFARVESILSIARWQSLCRIYFHFSHAQRTRQAAIHARCSIHDKMSIKCLHRFVCRRRRRFEFSILFCPKRLSRISYLNSFAAPLLHTHTHTLQRIEIPSWMRLAIIIYFLLYQVSNRTHNQLHDHLNGVTFFVLFHFVCAQHTNTNTNTYKDRNEEDFSTKLKEKQGKKKVECFSTFSLCFIHSHISVLVAVAGFFIQKPFPSETNWIEWRRKKIDFAVASVQRRPHITCTYSFVAYIAISTRADDNK